MTEMPDLLPEETYRILGKTLTVRSNSREVLRYLRWVYGYFRSDGRLTSRAPAGEEAAALTLEILDRMDPAKELLVRGNFGSYVIRGIDLYTWGREADGAPDPVFPFPLSYVESFLMRDVARVSRDYHLIHGGAVNLRGRAVVLPGMSGRGKTTLCLKLVSRGFTLFSDEIAAVRRDDGTVEPFPRRVKLDERSRSLLGLSAAHLTKAVPAEDGQPQWLLDVEDEFPNSVADPADLFAVILLQGFTDRTRLEPVSQTRALLALAQLSLWQPEDLSAAIFAFTDVMSRVRCFDLLVGDLDEAADLICDLVAGDD